MRLGAVRKRGEEPARRAVSLDEAYGRVRDHDVWLVGCDIPEYPNATLWNHQPKRPRKLLLHRREIRRFADKAREKGLTLVPLRMYFNERGGPRCCWGCAAARRCMTSAKP